MTVASRKLYPSACHSHTAEEIEPTGLRGLHSGVKPFRCVGKIPWKRKWQPAPVFLPGEFLGQGSLGGYNLWGCKEWDMTRLTSTFKAYIVY